LLAGAGMNDLIRHLTSDVRLNAEADSIVGSVSFSLEKRQILILTRGRIFRIMFDVLTLTK
jgi:hypothetical protein